MYFEEHLYNTLDNYSYMISEEKLGVVFYPCKKAIREALEKSMS